jgi:ribosomal protein L40E
MLAGTLVEWFNYYVIKDTFSVMGINIPRLWISLFSVFLTSVVILIITSYNELKNQMKRFETLSLSGTNWKTIWQQKEESAAKMNTNVGIKTLIFLATVAFSVISTTQLAQYTEVGLLVIVPFIVILLLAFIIELFVGSKKQTLKQALSSWLIEPTKTCEKCGTENLFDGVYCIKCKESFAHGIRVLDKTVECTNCQGLSPVQSQFCRFCGNPFSPATIPISEPSKATTTSESQKNE